MAVEATEAITAVRAILAVQVQAIMAAREIQDIPEASGLDTQVAKDIPGIKGSQVAKDIPDQSERAPLPLIIFY
jgi:hypothetical protein